MSSWCVPCSVIVPVKIQVSCSTMPTVLCKLSRDTSRISTPSLMIVAVKVGIYNVPATVRNESTYDKAEDLILGGDL